MTIFKIEPENWKVSSINQNYIVSDLGRVRSLLPRGDKEAGHYLTQLYCPERKCLVVRLHEEGSDKFSLRRVHVLVAREFVKNPHNYECVSFLDENRQNPRASNLVWSNKINAHKLSPQEILQCLQRYKQGARVETLCKKYGINRRTIASWLSGKRQKTLLGGKDFRAERKSNQEKLANGTGKRRVRNSRKRKRLAKRTGRSNPALQGGIDIG